MLTATSAMRSCVSFDCVALFTLCIFQLALVNTDIDFTGPPKPNHGPPNIPSWFIVPQKVAGFPIYMPQPPIFGAGSSSDYVNSWGDYRWNNFYDQSVIDEPANDPVYGTSSGSQEDIGFNTSPTDPPDTTEAATEAPAEEAAIEASADATTEAPAAEVTTVAGTSETARPAREFRHPSSSTNLLSLDENKNNPSLPTSPTQLLQMLFDTLVSTTTHKPRARAAKATRKPSSASGSTAESAVAKSRLSAPFLLQLPTRKLAKITTHKQSRTLTTKLPQFPVSLQNLFGTSVVGRVGSTLQTSTVGPRVVRDFLQTDENSTGSTFAQTDESKPEANFRGPANSSKPVRVVWDLFQVAVARVPSPDNADYIVAPGPGSPVFRSLLHSISDLSSRQVNTTQDGIWSSQAKNPANILQLSLNKSEGLNTAVTPPLPILLSPLINHLAKQTTRQADNTTTPAPMTTVNTEAKGNEVPAVDPEMPLAMRRRGLCSVMNGSKRHLGICIKNNTVQNDCDGMVIKTSSHCFEPGSVCCFEVDE